MCVGEVEIDLDELRSKRRREARFAQRFVYHLGPKDAPLLPLSNHKYEQFMSDGGAIKQIAAWYARSLAVSGYKVFDHPNFEVFGSGVMGSSLTPNKILADPDLKARFKPRNLVGLGPGLIWTRPSNIPANKDVYFLWPSPNSSVCRSGLPACRGFP
jgi:hypothetical protein